MRTAILSDVHGHLPELEAALRHIDTQRCDRILCLGDVVGGGPDGEAVVVRLKTAGIPILQGSHDIRDEDPSLSADSRSFLKNLPLSHLEGNVAFSHSGPRPRDRLNLLTSVEAWNVFEASTQRLLFVGHLHIPVLWGLRNESACEACRHPWAEGRPFRFDPTDHYIICPGSVASSRDGIRAPRYLIYDEEKGEVELMRVQ